MPDTVKLHLDPDYFPLMEGYKLKYHHTSTEFDGIELVDIEIKDLRAFREDAHAIAVLTRSRQGNTATETYKIHKTVKKVSAEGGVLQFSRVEFPLPPVVGKRWTEAPNLHEIAALDASIDVPAGKFHRCLRVNTYIAGGDGGSAIRYYGPGVGYVYEEYSDETWGSRVRLVGFEVPPLRR